jgi:hypothetical protein
VTTLDTWWGQAIAVALSSFALSIEVVKLRIEIMVQMDGKATAHLFNIVDVYLLFSII